MLYRKDDQWCTNISTDSFESNTERTSYSTVDVKLVQPTSEVTMRATPTTILAPTPTATPTPSLK